MYNDIHHSKSHTFPIIYIYAHMYIPVHYSHPLTPAIGISTYIIGKIDRGIREEFGRGTELTEDSMYSQPGEP